MQKTVLAFNFTAERLRDLKLACMLLKLQLRAVPREDMLQPLGYLAGMKEVPSVAERYKGDEAKEEMLLLVGFTRPDLDRLLSAIKRGKLKQINLKAMLTPYNAKWNALKLQQEIGQEHLYMHGRKVAKPKHFASKS